MNKSQSKKFFFSLVVFSLIGQVAWVVENMYFNVFIYKMFHASASSISLMVQLSAITATVTTLLIGALSDKVGSRKGFICGGYILWGLSILAFAFIRTDSLIGIAGSVTAAASLGCTLVIAMDCVMTFFGSSANDACFNAWLTDMGDDSNRGAIEGINAMMPLVAILVVFGGFIGFNLDEASAWVLIYLIIGIVVIGVGILGFFVIDDSKSRAFLKEEKEKNSHVFANIVYGFRPSVIKENKLLYVVLGAFAVFGISIQTFMPYLILYYEQSLHMDNYVLVMAPAIIIAAVITAFYGKLYDKVGFESSAYPTVAFLMIGYILLFLFRNTVLVFLGSLFMMTGYLTGMAIFGAMIRDHTPQNKSGQFQGLRIAGQVLIPGIIGPAIGAFVLRNADQIVNNDGTTSFIPNAYIYLAALIVAVLVFLCIFGISQMRRLGHFDLTMEEAVTDSSFCSYPRPQLKRDSFLCLNGTWDSGERIPFPLQSSLSGLPKFNRFTHTYTRKFTIPEDFVKDKILLHFDAVDQIATVTVDGEKVGYHEGGYLPFTCDITSFGSGEHTLSVSITDRLSKVYPYGKQTLKRGGMWYTPVSGIWQSVWVESVPEHFIEKLFLTPSLQGVDVSITSSAKQFHVEVFQNRDFDAPCILSKDFSCKDFTLEIPNPILWSPENPHLYGLRIRTENDCVTSYFALRTIRKGMVNGKERLLLNGKPYFFHGVLDQGYYPQGIFLPNNESGYEKDILRMKELGFNTLRKHIKIEPAYFYEACDRLGMIVFQDMVNNGSYSFLRDTALPTLGTKNRSDKRLHPLRSSRFFFEQHMLETISHLYNYPCVCYYTIFNEGWGQFKADEMYEKAKGQDGTRIYDATSGWFTQNQSDVTSEHVYFHAIPQTPSDRAIIVSEFGGYSMRVKDHTYSKYSNYGYKNYADSDSLTRDIVRLYEEEVIPYIKKGLCGTIYTQLSDVEDETNGFYTYDRTILKVEKEALQEVAAHIQAAMKEI